MSACLVPALQPVGRLPYLRTGDECCASSSSMHSGHQASMFHIRLPAMASRMLPNVISRPAMIGDAIRQVKSILRMPVRAFCESV